MASGHVNRAKQAEHMAAPTNAALVKKSLANPEPSTHGPLRPNRFWQPTVAIGGEADMYEPRP